MSAALPLSPANHDPTSQAWLSAIASQMLQAPDAKDLIDAVRDEAGLVDPLNTHELSDNHKVPRHKVRRITERYLCQAEWTGDLELLNYVFRLDLLRPSLTTFFLPKGTDPTPEEHARAELNTAAFYRIVLASGLQRLFADIFLDLFTDYAISGSLRPVSPLPPWFVGSVFEIPFLGDSLLVSVTTRLTDLREQLSLLRSEHRRLFITGRRDRARKSPVRDLWVLDQYLQIKDVLPEQLEHDKQMAALLGHDEEELIEATVLDELLRRFAESEWKHELDRYDLERPVGIRQAKNFLKQIVHRQRQACRTILQAMPYLRDE